MKTIPRRSIDPSSVLLFILSALTVAGCSGGGGGGGESGVEESRVVTGDVQTALESIGLKTLRTDSAEISNPVIVIGGQSSPDALANDVDTLFKCRENTSDAVFHLDTRSADLTHLEPPADTVRRLNDALAILEQKGIQHGTVVGHNTGGLVARKALEAATPSSNIQTGLAVSAIQIRLMTFGTPFDGVPGDVMRPAYPEEFQQGSSFIKTQGPLPANVEHFKYDVDLPVPNTLVTADQPDGLFITSQIHLFKSQFNTKVDNDPQVRVNLRQNYSSLPFVLPQRMNEALDAAGLPASRCVRPREFDASSSSARLSVRGAAAPSVGVKIRVIDPANTAHKRFDQRDFASFGLIAPTSGGFIDLNLPTVIIIHGDNGSASNYDNLEDQYAQKGYNVIRWVYQQSSNPSGQFAGEIDQLAANYPSMEGLTDAFIAAMRKLREFTGQHQITFVAHSMGGLIVRHALTKERPNTLAGTPDFFVTYISIATPFNGAGALSGGAGVISTIFLNVGSFFPGNEYYRALVDDDFLGGSLGGNATHYKIESAESGTDQDVITIEGQRRDNVDNDPQRIFIADVPDLPVQAGHVEILNSFENTPAIVDLTQKAQEASNSVFTGEGGTTSTVVTSTTTSTRNSTSTREHSTSTAHPTSTVTTSTPTSSTSSSSTTSVVPDQFSCLDGNYFPVNSSCGLSSVNLLETSGKLQASPFGANGVVNFNFDAVNVASATNMSIFAVPGHICTITCLDSQAGSVVVHCADSFSACDQNMAGPGNAPG